MLLYYHGFRFFNMGYASAMAVLLLVVAFAATLTDHPRQPPPRALRDDAMSGAAVGLESTAPTRRAVPTSIRRRRLLISIADHSLLIVAAIAFLAPVVFIGLTSLMTTDQALSSQLWPSPFPWRNYVDVFSSAPLWRWALNSFHLREPRDDRGSSSPASRSRTRSLGCAGGA